MYICSEINNFKTDTATVNKSGLFKMKTSFDYDGFLSVLALVLVAVCVAVIMLFHTGHGILTTFAGLGVVFILGVAVGVTIGYFNEK